MRDARATHNRLAVSAGTMEPALNLEAPLDLGLLVDKGDITKITRASEPNTDEATGKEEADNIYLKDRQVSLTPNFKRLQPQHLAFLAAYGLGVCVSSEVTAGVYQHLITPINGDLQADRSNPTFTAAQQLGNGILKTLLSSLMVDELTLTAAKNSWPTLSAKLAGTGKVERNLITQNISGLGNATTLTLSHKIEGSDAAGRLASVHQVRFKKTGDSYWRNVQCTVASSASPAVLTIVAPLGTGDGGTYEVIYVPDEDTALITGTATSAPAYNAATGTSLLTDSAQTMIADEHIGRWVVFTGGAAQGWFFKITDNDTDEITVEGDMVSAGALSGDAYVIQQFGWLPLPAKVAEPPLYITAFRVVVGGEWDGSAFQGGRVMAADLNSVKWNFKNALTPELTPGAGQSQVASQALRKRREQTLEVDRKMLDAVYQLMADPAEFSHFGFLIEATGGEIGSTGHDYACQVVLPWVSLTSNDPKVGDERLEETMQLRVLEGDTYPSVIVKVINAWPAYCQAA